MTQWWAGASIVLALLLASPAQAQQFPDPQTAAGRPLVARARAGGPADADSVRAAASWRSRASVDGTVRLIAGLAEPRAAFAAIDMPARVANRAALSRVVSRLGSRAQAATAMVVLPLLVVNVDAAGVDALLADPAIGIVEEDRAARRQLAQSVPLVQADQVWAQGYRGTGWTVAVLDDGVDAGHPAFGGRVVAEACYSGHGVPSASLCPGGVLSSTTAGAAKPCPTCTHGTHVAGVVAGDSGVAPEASLIAIQVFSRDQLAYFSDIVQAIDRVLVLAATYRIAAVNLSIGAGTTFPTTCDAMSASVFNAFASLRAAGIAPVVSSGNSNSPNGLEFPACLSNAVSVASTSKSDVVQPYATAAYLQLLAPGGSITGPVPGGGYGVKSGTSMAAPHVAGTWALIGQRVPSASVSAVLTALKSTGLPLIDPRNGLSFRRIRIADASEALASFAVSPTAGVLPAAGGTLPVSLTSSSSDATWTALSSAGWLTPSPASGTGSAIVTLSVSAHTLSVQARVGLATIAGEVVTVTQAGATPVFSLPPVVTPLSSMGETRALWLTSSVPDAPWVASSSQSWLTVSPTSGLGSGALILTAAPHQASATPRTATVTAGGQSIAVTQAGAAPHFTVAPSSLSAPLGGTIETITVLSSVPDAEWTATSSASWIAVSPASGKGSAALTVTIAPTTPLETRTATITVAGRLIAVLQVGGDPGVTVSETAWAAPEAGGSHHVGLDISASTGSWTAISSVPWVTVSPADGTGDTVVTIAALPGTSEGAGLPAGTVLPSVPPHAMSFTVTQPLGGGSRSGVVVFVPHAPQALHHRYLAEGASSAFFDTRLALLNPGDIATTATVSFLRSGHAALDVQVDVPAHTRRTVWPHDIPGLSNAEFSTTVAAAQPLVVDRTMTWDGSGYGSHAETASSQAASRWYFAEGATHSGFSLFYLLQNPGTVAVTARVRYLRAAAPPLEKTYVLAPQSRTNIWINLEEFPGLGRALASAEFSAVIDTLGGEPIIAERAMYRSTNGRTFDAGHESMGVRTPSTRWVLAEGRTGAFFDEFILVANPTDTDAAVRVTYLLDGGTTFVKTLTAPANARLSIWVDHETIPGVGGEPLADVAVSATLDSLNGVPLIVERAMWWPGDGTTWHEAHDAAGAIEAGTVWALAEGEVGGAGSVQTYVLMANTSEVDGLARVTLVFEDGTSATRLYDLRALSRTNAAIGVEFAAEATGRRFGVLVEAIGADETSPIPLIVVERAMYSDASGVPLAAGSNAVATKLR